MRFDILFITSPCDPETVDGEHIEVGDDALISFKIDGCEDDLRRFAGQPGIVADSRGDQMLATRRALFTAATACDFVQDLKIDLTRHDKMPVRCGAIHNHDGGVAAELRCVFVPAFANLHYLLSGHSELRYFATLASEEGINAGWARLLELRGNEWLREDEDLQAELLKVTKAKVKPWTPKKT